MLRMENIIKKINIVKILFKINNEEMYVSKILIKYQNIDQISFGQNINIK